MGQAMQVTTRGQVGTRGLPLGALSGSRGVLF